MTKPSTEQILHDRFEKAQAAAAGMRPSTVFDSEDGSPKEDAHLGNLRVLWQKSAVFALVNARKLATLARRVSASPLNPLVVAPGPGLTNDLSLRATAERRAAPRVCRD